VRSRPGPDRPRPAVRALRFPPGAAGLLGLDPGVPRRCRAGRAAVRAGRRPHRRLERHPGLRRPGRGARRGPARPDPRRGDRADGALPGDLGAGQDGGLRRRCGRLGRRRPAGGLDGGLAAGLLAVPDRVRPGASVGPRPGRRRGRSGRRAERLRQLARRHRPARSARRPGPAHPDPGPRRARAGPGAAEQPGRGRRRGVGRQDQRRRALLLPADRRLGFRLRPAAGDDQRPRAGRGHRPDGAGRGRGVRRLPRVRGPGGRRGGARRPRPAGGPPGLHPPAGRGRRRLDHHGLPGRWPLLRRTGAGARPGRHQRAGLPQHADRHPRRLRAVRQRALRQLRRAAVRPRRHGARRGLRLGHRRPRHRLRADRPAGGRGRRRREQVGHRGRHRSLRV
ncbi:MAG: Putative serine protease, partial [uncultured Blastococcus sp.]